MFTKPFSLKLRHCTIAIPSTQFHFLFFFFQEITAIQSTRTELRTPFGDSVITIEEVFNTAGLEHALYVRQNSSKNKQDSVGNSSKYSGDLKIRPKVRKKIFSRSKLKTGYHHKKISLVEITEKYGLTKITQQLSRFFVHCFQIPISQEFRTTICSSNSQLPGVLKMLHNKILRFKFWGKFCINYDGSSVWGKHFQDNFQDPLTSSCKNENTIFATSCSSRQNTPLLLIPGFENIILRFCIENGR